MRVTHAEFQEAIDSQIRQLTGQEEDPSFVSTLRNYVLGLVKHHGASDPAQLHRHLREFLEGKTAPFVAWLTEYMQSNTIEQLPGARNAGAEASGSGRLRSVVSSSAQQRNSRAARDRDGAAPMDVDGSGTRRQRSRSPASAPVTHNRLATARRVPTAAAGATAGVFQDAIRRAAPATDLQIKQELFAAGPPVATGGHAGALDREAKIEAFGGPAASAAANGVVHNGAYVATGVPAPPVDPESVVIMNVHYDATPEQLGVFFHERCGGVVRVTILKNAHGMPKGYAYMQLASADAALQAQDISGTDFMSRQLRVVPKQTRPPPPAMLPPWLQQMQMMQMLYGAAAPGLSSFFGGGGGGRGYGGFGRGGYGGFGRGRGHGGGGLGRGRGKAAAAAVAAAEEEGAAAGHRTQSEGEGLENPESGERGLTEEEKRERRRKSNRVSARRARQRKAMDLAALQQLVAETAQESRQLRERVADLTATNSVLVASIPNLSQRYKEALAENDALRAEVRRLRDAPR